MLSKLFVSRARSDVVLKTNPGDTSSIGEDEWTCLSDPLETHTSEASVHSQIGGGFEDNVCVACVTTGSVTRCRRAKKFTVCGCGV